MTIRTPKWVERYLGFLNIPVEQPSLAYLAKICKSHLCTFPFENISKLIFSKEKGGAYIPTVEEFLCNFERYNFGGTCYVLNVNVMRLLDALGFDCHHVMLGGQHMGIIVRLPSSGERVYVDCGAAAPFFAPVRFERDPENVTSFGLDSIKIRSLQGSKIGDYRYSRYTNDVLSGPEWDFSPDICSEVSDFADVMDASCRPGTTFMTILRCQLWQLDLSRSATLVDNKFSSRFATGETQTRLLNNRQELREVIDEQFSLPRLPVEEALRVLETLGVKPF